MTAKEISEVFAALAERGSGSLQFFSVNGRWVTSKTDNPSEVTRLISEGTAFRVKPRPREWTVCLSCLGEMSEIHTRKKICGIHRDSVRVREVTDE